MIRYRTALLVAALIACALFAAAWRSADTAPGVQDAGEGLAIPLDDNAIYFQYARQALRGEWLRYNPGAELSTGVTSPLYFLLLTALMGLGLSGPLAALLLGAAAFLLGLVALDCLARRLFPDLPPWWAGLLLLSQGAWAAWHFNGMETGLLLALSFCAVLAVVDGGPATVFIALSALAWTRPEGQVLAGLLALAWAAARAAERLPKLAVLLPLLAWPSLLPWILQGHLSPDSLRAKSTALQAGRDLWALWGDASAYALGVIKGAWMGAWGGADAVGQSGGAASLNPVGPLFPPLLFLGALFGLLQPRPRNERPLWLSLGAALALLLGLLSWRLPMGWHQHRYLGCTAPLLWLGALAGLQALRKVGGNAKILAAALLALWVAHGLAGWPWHLQRCRIGAIRYAESNRNSALALRTLPPGPVAVADAGLLAYYSERPIVDLLGVTEHRLALAQAAGKGAQLEALLNRPAPPRWAALHEDRGDVDLGAWLALGLLRPLAQPEAGVGMRFYAWDWHDAAERHRPPLPCAAILGELNVADLQQEAAARYTASGPAAERTRILNSRDREGRRLFPEGGRIVLEDAFDQPGASALQLRAVFDRPGTLRVSDPSGRLLALALIDASPSERYSELSLSLPQNCPTRIRISFINEKGQPSAWTSCHYWFVETSRP